MIAVRAYAACDTRADRRLQLSLNKIALHLADDHAIIVSADMTLFIGGHPAQAVDQIELLHVCGITKRDEKERCNTQQRTSTMGSESIWSTN